MNISLKIQQNINRPLQEAELKKITSFLDSYIPVKWLVTDDIISESQWVRDIMRTGEYKGLLIADDKRLVQEFVKSILTNS